MLNPPKTLAEAQDFRYGIWTWDTTKWPYQSLKGQPYKKGQCAYEVSNIKGAKYQCRHKKGYGPNMLYCRECIKFLI